MLAVFLYKIAEYFLSSSTHHHRLEPYPSGGPHDDKAAADRHRHLRVVALPPRSRGRHRTLGCHPLDRPHEEGRRTPFAQVLQHQGPPTRRSDGLAIPFPMIRTQSHGSARHRRVFPFRIQIRRWPPSRGSGKAESQIRRMSAWRFVATKTSIVSGAGPSASSWHRQGIRSVVTSG